MIYNCASCGKEMKKRPCDIHPGLICRSCYLANPSKQNPEQDKAICKKLKMMAETLKHHPNSRIYMRDE